MNGDHSSVDFLYFLSSQFFRTRNLREKVKYASQRIVEPGFIDRVWPIESQIYTTNFGFSLYSERRSYRITILEAPDGEKFVVGDQPVINLNNHTQEAVRLYYPISPDMAVIYEPSESYGPSQRMVSKLEFEFLNFQMYSRSLEQLYAQNERELLAYKGMQKGL